MQGKATILGHPIHPMIIPFPIAFLSGALICDIISHWGDPVFWPRMAVALLGLGILGALAASAFGLVDYFTAPMSANAKKIGTAHLAVNAVAIAIFIVDFFLRVRNATAPAGYVLTVLGVLALGMSGFLGGHLAYHFGVGVAPSARNRGQKSP